MNKKIMYLKTVALFCVLLFSVSEIIAQQIDAKAAMELIGKNAPAIGLSKADLFDSRISDAYTDESDVTIIYLQQTYKSIDVFNYVQTVAFQNDQLVSSTGKRIANIAQMANVKEAHASFSAGDAVKAAAIHLRIPSPGFLTAAKQIGPQQFEFGDLGISSVSIKSKMIWLSNDTSKTATLCWQVEVQPNGSPDYWLVNVDANKGNVINKINLNVSCNWTKPKRYAESYTSNFDASTDLCDDDGEEQAEATIDTAEYRVIPFPAESLHFPGGTPTVKKNPWTLAGSGNKATTLKWNSNGTTTFDSTRGNNVLAQEDRNGNDGFGLGAVSTTKPPVLTFDFKPNFNVGPANRTNQKFAITNLFYWNNIMHDISYQYGFTEVTGNFQDNNLGRGGKAHDFVFADAQDGLGENNADFATPPDGYKPRMQMYLFDPVTPGGVRIDGDLDNGVICHEYTHGISNRLTGGPSNTSCLNNAEQMGEGWSDYFALMVTTNWSKASATDGSKKRPLGTYVLGEMPDGAGIRTYPYSTNLSIDPWTYADLSSTGGDVHTIGEIWCSMVWEMTWSIIRQTGIKPNLYRCNAGGGNNIALKLVMMGMKLQPCSPGFVDGRNAILKADTILYKGVHSRAIWRAFAKRGLGVFASEGSSNNYRDGKADHSVPSAIAQSNFNAVKQNETALLQWENPDQKESSAFVIERSVDGKNFDKVGTVNANESSNAYNFTDHFPINGVNYYRLSQSAADGETAYSQVRSVSFNTVTIAPNPAKDKVNITVTGNTKLLKVTLTNATGQQLESYNMNSEMLQAVLPHVAAGLYYIRITGDGISETRKLVIQ